jgi:hypothetical protein
MTGYVWEGKPVTKKQMQAISKRDQPIKAPEPLGKSELNLQAHIKGKKRGQTVTGLSVW